MLVWWLHHQSYILCFITFVTNHAESKVHQMIWFQSGRYIFCYWNQFRILVYSNLLKSPPWKQKSLPKSGKSKKRPITHKIAPWRAISPPLKTTAVDLSSAWLLSRLGKHFFFGINIRTTAEQAIVCLNGKILWNTGKVSLSCSAPCGTGQKR